MGRFIDITASDEHQLDAYLAEPPGTPHGGVVILQEFFGINAHIRRITDDYASYGYVAVAPALFDRVEKNVDVPYDAEGMARGRALRAKLDQNETLVDVQAAVDLLRRRGLKVAAIGYCWGGVLAYLESLRGTGLTSAVAYYGAQIPDYIGEPTRVPVLMHFAGYDEYMNEDDPERVAAAHPEIELYRYPGTEHGFNCDVRPYYDAAAAGLALGRTKAFLGKTLA
jgi:carboxymethylenebutenolidase